MKLFNHKIDLGIGHSFLCSILMFCNISCTREADVFPESQPHVKMPICWDVNQKTDSQTRALINNSLLQTACTPKADNSHESIGLWGEYTYSTDNIKMVEFWATPLTYAPISEDTNPHNNWNYPGGVRFWESGAIYNFRACYPQALMTSLMTEMSTSIFQGAINTFVVQEDILVAATQVNTRTTDLMMPVSLSLQHIFSAVKFKVKAVDGYVPSDDEGITSCWLQNKTNDTDLFSSSGYLVHSGNAAPQISWYTYESSIAPMYVWNHTGVSFASENTLYTPNGGLTGNEYTQNDGWLLIVPQQVKENTLTFCYKMKNSPDHSYSVNIPAITYEPGKQYVYVLEIRGSEVNVTLTIADWNYKESSYDIVM